MTRIYNASHTVKLFFCQLSHRPRANNIFLIIEPHDDSVLEGTVFEATELTWLLYFVGCVLHGHRMTSASCAHVKLTACQPTPIQPKPYQTWLKEVS